MGYEFLQLTLDDPLSRIVLDRPERRNALSLACMREIIGALDEVAASLARVLVIEGTGPAFSAGHDIAEMSTNTSAEFYEEVFTTCVAMMMRLHTTPQPVIAKVQGVATVAGCQLVASCDLAVASSDARFATPGVNIGLFCSTPMVPVHRSIGPKRALEMLFTGDMIDAATALEWGLVNAVVPADDLESAVQSLVTRIARSSPGVLALGKRAFYAQDQLTEAAAYAVTEPVMVNNAQTGDAHEGMQAFLEKRAPEWKK